MTLREVVVDDEMRALYRLWAGNIRRARVERTLSQVEAARGCTVNQTTYSRWERGELVPSETKKRAIAAFYGIAARDMFPLELPDAEPAAS